VINNFTRAFVDSGTAVVRSTLSTLPDLLQALASFLYTMLRIILSTSAARTAAEPFQTSRAMLRAPRALTQRTLTTIRPIHSKPSTYTKFTFPSHPRASRNSTILQRLRSSLRFFHNTRTCLSGKPTSPNTTASLGSPASAAEAESRSLSGRLKKLSREYGWSAVGVYLTLSALDFPFCYLLVRYVGADTIGE
jgi:hypothetical protein